MSRTPNFVLAFLLASSLPLVAQPNPFELEYGKTYPIQPVTKWKNDYGVPIALHTFGVPMNASAGLPMFNEFIVAYWTEDETVFSSSASRVYPDWDSCEQAEASVISASHKKLPDLTEVGKFKYKSGELVLDISCAISAGDRYPKLNFMLSLPR